MSTDGWDWDFAGTLGDISNAMGGFQNDIGIEADDQHTSADRIVWIPDGTEMVPIRCQPSDGHAIGESRDSYRVSVYAPDYGQLIRQLDKLRAALDATLSNWGYEITRDKPKPRGGTAGAQGWGIAPVIAIRRPVYDAAWRAGHVATTVMNVTTGPSPLSIGS